MARSRKVGDLFVEITAKDQNLDAGLEGAKQKVDQASTEMGESVNKKIGGAFENTGQKIEDSTRGVRKLSGAITSTVGVVTGLLGAFTAIAAILISIVSRVTAMREESERAAAAAESAGRAFGFMVTSSAMRRDDAQAVVESAGDEVALAERRLEIQKQYRSEFLASAREQVQNSDKVRLVEEEIAKAQKEAQQAAYDLGVQRNNTDAAARLEASQQRLNELYAERNRIIEEGVAPERQRIDNEIAAAEYQIELAKMRAQEQKRAQLDALRASTDELSAAQRLAAIKGEQGEAARLAAEIALRAEERRAREAANLGDDDTAIRIVQQARIEYEARLENVRKIEQAEKDAQDRLARQREEQIAREAEMLERAYANVLRNFENSFRSLLNQFSQGSANSAKRIEQAVNRLASRESWQVHQR